MTELFASKRTIAAGTVALAGILVAGYALWPYLSSGRARTEAIVAPQSPQQQRLTVALLDTETAEAPESAIDAAVARIGMVIDANNLSGLNGRDEDLAAAFSERLRTTIDADYQRDLNAAMARGVQGPDQPPNEEDMERWEMAADWTRGAPLGVEEVEVFWVRRSGRPVPNGADEGFDTSTCSFDKTPFGPNRSQANLSVIEVRLPMGLRPVRVHDDKDPQGAVLVGYQFAWHNERNQWTPYATVIYSPKGETYACLPFY